MNNLVPLVYCLDSFTGGGSNSTFIPYEEHHLLGIEKRKENPIYCPDLYPFLCSKTSNGHGYCKKSDIDCQNKTNGKLPIKYS